MRDLIFIVATMVFTWIAVYSAIDLLGETIIKDSVKVAFLLVITAILSVITLKFIFGYACCRGVWKK